MRRWSVVRPVLALVLSTVLAGACGEAAAPRSAPARATTASPAASASPAAGSGGPIRIGIIVPETGWSSSFGPGMKTAFELPFAASGDRVAGHPVQFTVLDSQSSPSGALNAYRTLVLNDHVSMVFGVINSAGGIAVAHYAAAHKVPFLTQAAAAELTRQDAAPNIFRFTSSTYQWSYAPAKWVKQHLGWKHVYFIGLNYAAAHEGFQGLEKAMGKAAVVQAFWPAPSAVDFSPYLAKIDPSKANGVITAVWGAGTDRLINQYKQLGLASKLPLFGYADTFDPAVLPHMTTSSVGDYSSYYYCPSAKGAANLAFVKPFKAKLQHPPGPYAYSSYVSGEFAVAAIGAVHGDVSNSAALNGAVATTRLNGPTGPVSLDPHRGLVLNFYILKVAQRNGALANNCVGVIHNVQDPYALFPQ